MAQAATLKHLMPATHHKPVNLESLMRKNITAFAFMTQKNKVPHGPFTVGIDHGHMAVDVQAIFGKDTVIGAREDIIKGMLEVAPFEVKEGLKHTRLSTAVFTFNIRWKQQPV